MHTSIPQHPIAIRYRVLAAGFLSLTVLILAARAGTWTPVVSDEFVRADSPTIGNNWVDPYGVGNIAGNALTLTVPPSGTGIDIRVARPIAETSLNHRIEASFVMPNTGDGLAHSVFLRGKSVVINGQEIYPMMMVTAWHFGTISTQLMYRGGTIVNISPNGAPAFTPVAGHTYTLAAQITNNFPAVVSATLTDETTGTQVANATYEDYGIYTGSKRHMSPDFETPGVTGLSMWGGAGTSVSFTKVTTYAWSETGALEAPFQPAVGQYDGKNHLASPFPRGGTEPYSIRWYRGTGAFTPPLTIDGSGTGTGTYIGNTFEVVDANPPAGVSNFTTTYRAVYFDNGDNAAVGVSGLLTYQNSPTTKNFVVPLWIGDSITYGFATSSNNPNKSPATYSHTYLEADPEFSAAYSMPIAVWASNLGIPGYTSTNFTNLLPRIIGQARLIGATFANIMLGANDSKDTEAISAVQYKANLEAIIGALKAARPDIKIVLNKPLWFKPDTGIHPTISTASLARINEYHAVLNGMADGTSFLVGDRTAYDELEAHGWIGNVGEYNLANTVTAYPPAPTGGQSYLIDGLHPYDGGNEMIAKLEWGPNAKAIVFGNVTPIPVVNAGSDQAVALPASSATLTGSAASGNGAIISYSWAQLSGGTATLTSPASATTNVTGLSTGVYVFRLTATDDQGGVGHDDIQLTVQGSSFASWLTDNGLSGGDALRAADPDGNGIANLIEYAFDIPHGSTTGDGLPTVDHVDGVLSMTYVQPRSDIVYQPEWSPSLGIWDTDGINITTVEDVSVASIIIGERSRLFMRLKLTSQ